MGRKKKETKTFEQYCEDLKIAKQYELEIEQIKKNYGIYEKEDFIAKSKDIIKQKEFLEYFVFALSAYGKNAKDVNLYDEYWDILLKFGADIDSYSVNFYEYDYSEDGLYIYYTYSGCFQEETESIMTLPATFDVYSLLEELKQLDEKCDAERIKINEQKKIEEQKQKEKEAAEEYELYLKLKAKYES